MFSRPEISIVLTTHNRRELLPRAVESVRRQSVTDWELIIVDDGGTDQTFAALAPVVREEPRVIYVYQAHAGHPAACNRGFALARGAWITLLDSDDEYLPQHLESRLEHLAAHPELDLIHGGFELLGDAEAWYVRDATDPRKRIHLGECVVGGTLFGRAAVFRALDGFDVNVAYGYDFDFVNRAARRFKIGKVDFPTYRYHREHDQSLCRELERRLADRE